MEERGRVSRRQFVTMAGVMTVAAAATARFLAAQPEAAAVPDCSRTPCIGEAGYGERVARLFEDRGGGT